jgi:serine phosphatase RsbU (regulator of sigma subunit)
MNNELKILLLEDSETDADLLVRFLNKEKLQFSCTRVWNKSTFVSEIKKREYDLIIADHNLPQFSGMEAFNICKKENVNFPFILVTGSVSEKLLTEYAKEGIDDYILKDNLLRLPSAIDKILDKKKIEKLNTELSETNNKLNNAYFDIKDSINYAKLLQNAILPDRAILYDSFPGSFIIFKPKDILSGDFYWFEKKENFFIIAVADCTGHGVPGALLAMMGNNLITETVRHRMIAPPSEILSRLNNHVKRILKREKTSVSDGMDIAMCKIDLKSKELIYCGAKRPLFIERGQELIEYKPDKISIGEIDTTPAQFTDHKIKIKSGDRIFLFTDGFVDQFSEKTDRKIMVKRLKEIILTSSGLQYVKQKKFISDFFEKWKGNIEQTDDVLLMCIAIP